MCVKFIFALYMQIHRYTVCLCVLFLFSSKMALICCLPLVLLPGHVTDVCLLEWRRFSLRRRGWPHRTKRAMMGVSHYVWDLVAVSTVLFDLALEALLRDSQEHHARQFRLLFVRVNLFDCWSVDRPPDNCEPTSLHLSLSLSLTHARAFGGVRAVVTNISKQLTPTW